jgi:hypothetical protein
MVIKIFKSIEAKAAVILMTKFLEKKLEHKRL